MAQSRTRIVDYGLECPITYTLSVFEGKWKWLIIDVLSQGGTLRYGELKRNLQGITHKMLSQQLKELEKMELVTRKVYNQIPPKVEYSLTKKGASLEPIIELLCKWGEKNLPKGMRKEK